MLSATSGKEEQTREDLGSRRLKNPYIRFLRYVNGTHIKEIAMSDKCKCSYTLNDLAEMVNRIRSGRGLVDMPKQMVVKHWHYLKDNYFGKKNPYFARGRIGPTYVFNKGTCRILAGRISKMAYKKYGKPGEWRELMREVA